MIKRIALPLLLAASLVACGDDDPTAPPVAEVISAVGSATRAGVAGHALDSLVVRVTDADGDPVAGQPLVWSVVSGGGSITGAAQTDANGVGKGAWTLGTVVGTQTARVFAGTSLSVDFTATAALPGGTGVSIVRGNGQTGAVTQALADSLVVAVTLPDGRPAVGVDVQWQPGLNSGSVSPVVTRTGADGRAAVRWTLGTAAGVESVSALVAGSTGATFTATAAAGAPVTMTAVSGNAQGGPAGQPLPAPLVVELRDAWGNAVPGATVDWTVLSGGGTVSPASGVTDASGRAQTRWTLDATGAPGTVRASTAGVAPVTFTSPGSPPPPAAPVPARVIVFSGNGQSAPAGTPLSNPLVARVLDAAGTPVQGALVRWTVAAGRGSVADSVAFTDAAGLAQTTWDLGPEMGTTQAVDARVAGVAAAARFTAAGTAPAVVVLTKVAGDGQTQSMFTAVPVQPTVRVTLADGRPLLGAPVTWTAGVGATASPTSVAADSNGLARTTWTLGAGGPQTLVVASLGQSATFTATAVPVLSIYSGNNQQSSPSTPVPDSLVVRATRMDGSPIAGVTVQWTTASGTLSPTTSVTDAQGLARTSYTLQGGVGSWQVTARAPAYGNTSVVFTERGVNPVLSRAADNPTTGTAGVPLTMRVRLTHADGRPFPGQVIQFTGPGSRDPAMPVTDANGYATFKWVVSSPGTYTITAYDQAYPGVFTSLTATMTAP